MRALLFVFTVLGLIGNFDTTAQCEVNASATSLEITCGESVTLSAFGSSTGQLVLDEDFNSGGFGVGWSSTPGATSFSNPCSPAGVDGTTHAWMDNNTSVPRALTSAQYDLSAATAGVTICFDMLFAEQGDAAPCEGPDEPDEGVFLQYSIDGGTTWIDIHYFDPNGGNDPQLTNWNNWCFSVPAAGITSNTMFQWYQEADSGADYDHWGIDNVQIFMNDINSEVVWLHDGYSYGVGNPGGDNPTPVTPTSTTTYTAQITTGSGDVCTEDVTIIVNPPVFDVNVTAAPTTICDGDCATISGSAQIIQDPGGIETYENNEFALVASGSASVNINVQGINTNTITAGLIQNVTINGFDFSGSFFCTDFGGCDCNGSTIAFGSTCNLDASGFTVMLTAPGGCGTIILAPSGVASGNYNNTVFVPVGGTAFNGTFPNGGTWDPEEPFSNLDGCDPNGVWTLSFDAPGLGIGIGTLFGWSITFDDPPIYQPVCSTWSPTTGLSNPSDINTDACPTASETYTLTISNCTPGCPTYDEVISITVDPCSGCTPPNINVVPLSDCAPATVDLNNAIGAGSDPANVSFHASQADAQADVNPIAAGVSTSGSYWIRAEDPADPTCFLEYEVVVTISTLTYSASLVDENCGAGDGQISLTANSGVGPYDYSIDGGATTQGTGTFGGLTAGTYNIEITDQTTGCSVTGTESISNIGGPSIDALNITDPSCPGVCDGEITAVVSGGTPPYTYQWFDNTGTPIGTNSATITGLCAGDYSVEVTDGGGSTTQLFFDDFESGAPGWTLNVPMAPEGADPNYFEIDDDEGGVAPGGCGIAGNGDATLHITSVFIPGGGAAYDAGGLCGLLFCPESHRQCETPLINTVGQTGLTLNFDYIAGGDAPLDQATVWYDDGGGWTQLGGNLFSGTGACAPQGIWTAYSAALPASCENIPNLQIAIRWDNNDDGNGTDPSVAINNIEIVTSGSASCSSIDFATLTDPAADDATFTLSDFCTGDANAATGVVTPGGTFAFNPNPADGSTINPATGEITNGVLGTTYTVEYTTGGACPVSSTNTVTVNGITYNSVLTDENCSSGDGIIELNVVGGVGPFDYSIDNGATTQGANTFIGLNAGAYPVVITDNGTGCAASGSETIVNIGGPTIDNLLGTDPTCATACDGEISATVSGGTLPYTYQWLDNLGNPIGTNDPLITGLCAGGYSIEVSDASGICIATDAVTLTDPAGDDPSFTLTDFCEGDANSATGIVTPGGTFAFNPNPADGSSIDPTTGEITNGIAGTTYTVEYTTSGACPVSATNTVTVNGLTYNASITDENCGAVDGQIDLTAVGGTGPFDYSLDNGATTQGSGTFSGISAGAYQVVIIDNGTGCSVTGTESVSNIGGPSIDNVVANDPSCPGVCDGDITITVSGGTPPYTYQWFDDLGNPIGTNDPFLTNLCGGDYSVEVSDANGGSTILNTNYDFETGSGAGCDCPTGFNCNNDAGQVFDGNNPVYTPGDQGCVTGGTNYTNSLGAYSGTGYVYFYAGADNISAGPFTFAGGETVELCVYYAGPQGSGASGQNTANSHFSFGVDGTQVGPDVTVPVNTGWTQYCFTVTMTAGNHTFQILSGGAAQYALWFDDFTITDLSGGGGPGCPVTSNFTLVEPVAQDASFTLTDYCEGDPNAATGIVTPGGTFDFNPNPADGSSIDPTTGEITNGVPGTTYSVEYTIGGACPVSQINTVTVNGFTYNATLTDEACGAGDGEIVLNTVGGGPAFDYSIDNGVSSQGTNTFSGLTAGNYDILITDPVTGCSVSGTETIVNIGGPVIDVVNVTDETCQGLNDGSIDVATVSGGSGTYSYSWDIVPDPGTASVANLAPGTYTVTVTDDVSGCIATSTSTINPGPVCCDVTITGISGTDLTCLGADDGTITVIATGGIGALDYTIDNGVYTATNQTGSFTNIPEGLYTITVSDQNGCSESDVIEIFAPSAVTSNVAITNILCFGNTTGEIDVTANGGTPGYQYSIDNGVTWVATGQFTGLASGNYQVIVEDNNGCQSPVELVDITEPTELQIDISSTNEVCFEACDGTISWNGIGGTGPYSFALNGNVQAGSPVNDLCAGTYDYTLTDDNGCQLTGTVVIEAAVEVTLDEVIVTQDGCSSDCDGSIQVLSPTAVNYTMGGISNGTGFFGGLCADTYTIVIEDANGCSIQTTQLVSSAEQSVANFILQPGFLTTMDTELSVQNISLNADAYEWLISGPNGYTFDTNSEDFSIELPANDGGYQVCLVAINTAGCSDTLCQGIEMREDFVLWVPNSFTPNGDEFNNLLRAYAEGIDDYNFSFQIFNQWGELIWETKDIEQGWDGTYNGVVCQDGTYTWKIVVKDIYTDERRDFVGHVNLLK